MGFCRSRFKPEIPETSQGPFPVTHLTNPRAIENKRPTPIAPRTPADGRAILTS
jgi:hypothetical protein